jgi:tetratricopeptide (TPR) repeat protein
VHDSESGNFEYVGQTERARTSYSPVFQGQFVMFHYGGPFHELKFCVYDVDSDENLAAIQNKTLLGSCVVSLEDFTGGPVGQPARLQCRLASEDGEDLFGSPDGTKNSLVMFSAICEEEAVPGQFNEEQAQVARQQEEDEAAEEAEAAAAAHAQQGGGGGGGDDDDVDSQFDDDEEAASPEELALARMDAICDQLQAEGKVLESLEAMERGLILRRHYYGVDSEEVFQSSKEVAEMCNFLSMTYLQQGEFEIALELLKKAEILTTRHRMIRAVTYNNLGCYYRKRGKLQKALTFMDKALKIEGKHGAQSGAVTRLKNADTHLNMCTILSELKRHDKAIYHAKVALKLLRGELFPKRPAGEPPLDPATGDVLAPPAPSKDRIAVMGIAYHNLAVQQEYLRLPAECMESYKKGLELVQKHLGETHPLAQSLLDSMKAAKKNMRPQLRQLANQLKREARAPKIQRGNISNLIDERQQTVGANDMPFFPAVNSRMHLVVDQEAADREAKIQAHLDKLKEEGEGSDDDHSGGDNDDDDE